MIISLNKSPWIVSSLCQRNIITSTRTTEMKFGTVYVMFTGRYVYDMVNYDWWKMLIKVYNFSHMKDKQSEIKNELKDLEAMGY